AMPCQIMDHLAATGGVTDMHRILQVEMSGHRREIVGIVVHVVPVAGLRGPAVTAPVMRDDTVAASHEKHHLRVPVICREWPAMAENDGLPLTPVLVEDLNSVLGLDFAHGVLSFALGGRCCNSGRAAEIKPRASRCASNQEPASRGIVNLMPLRRFRSIRSSPRGGTTRTRAR